MRHCVMAESEGHVTLWWSRKWIRPLPQSLSGVDLSTSVGALPRGAHAYVKRSCALGTSLASMPQDVMAVPGGQLREWLAS